MKPVKNEKNCSSTETNNKWKSKSSRLLVSPECFAGRTKFFCGPHVRYLWCRRSV